VWGGIISFTCMHWLVAVRYKRGVGGRLFVSEARAMDCRESTELESTGWVRSKKSVQKPRWCPATQQPTPPRTSTYAPLRAPGPSNAPQSRGTPSLRPPRRRPNTAATWPSGRCRQSKSRCGRRNAGLFHTGEPAGVSQSVRRGLSQEIRSGSVPVCVCVCVCVCACVTSFVRVDHKKKNNNDNGKSSLYQQQQLKAY